MKDLSSTSHHTHQRPHYNIQHHRRPLSLRSPITTATGGGSGSLDDSGRHSASNQDEGLFTQQFMWTNIILLSSKTPDPSGHSANPAP
ncbi:Hypothetical protein FKW44_023662 [Caligus rogercresseyi]|uniref:Uncharacterized protein n=1 Tax=Caligus rogercresseyi TaxID=217165 RepID=A0A7T8GPA7_CALRO|nr:Hypothetical protein FKW44_023662 [Caligus rogercresseyi]